MSFAIEGRWTEAIDACLNLLNSYPHDEEVIDFVSKLIPTAKAEVVFHFFSVLLLLFHFFQLHWFFNFFLFLGLIFFLSFFFFICLATDNRKNLRLWTL
jgi:hypothetical protein